MPTSPSWTNPDVRGEHRELAFDRVEVDAYQRSVDLTHRASGA